MPFMPWSDAMIIDRGPIDGQHQQLVASINQLHDEFHAGNTNIAPILDYLVIYVDIHFADEERLMQLAGYGDLPAHREEHQRFSAQLKQVAAAFHRQEIAVDAQLVNLLKAWLTNHIMGTDREYAPALQAWRGHTQITESDVLVEGL